MAVEAVLRSRWGPREALERAVGTAADLVVRPGCTQYVGALLDAVRSDDLLMKLTIRAVAERVESLDMAEGAVVVGACRDAMQGMPERLRDEVFEDLAARKCGVFLGTHLLVSIESATDEEVAVAFGRDFGRLPPSARRRLDLDLLVARCLNRFGTIPLSSQLDELLDVVPLKELRDDVLQELVARRYAEALDLADVQPWHERRLAYLQRFTTEGETRACLGIREDLARVAALPAKGVSADRVLGRVETVPEVLARVPSNQVERFLAIVIARLPGRMTEEDHVLLGRRLYHPLHAREFHRAVHSRVKRVAASLPEEIRGAEWAAFYGAWLSERLSASGADAMVPFLREGLRAMDGRTRRELNGRLRERLGKGVERLEGGRDWLGLGRRSGRRKSRGLSGR